MKLISTTDFVLESKSKTNYFKETQNYANFLKQPLELWMFVPCDEDGNVLEEIVFSDQTHIYLNYYEKKDYSKRCDEYQQAKERVLFEGFSDEDLKEIEEWFTAYFGGKTIENLLNGSYKDIINLTETAIKQI